MEYFIRNNMSFRVDDAMKLAEDMHKLSQMKTGSRGTTIILLRTELLAAKY
jgi:hypothetical protein